MGLLAVVRKSLIDVGSVMEKGHHVAHVLTEESSVYSPLQLSRMG